MLHTRSTNPRFRSVFHPWRKMKRTTELTINAGTIRRQLYRVLFYRPVLLCNDDCCSRVQGTVTIKIRPFRAKHLEVQFLQTSNIGAASYLRNHAAAVRHITLSMYHHYYSILHHFYYIQLDLHTIAHCCVTYYVIVSHSRQYYYLCRVCSKNQNRNLPRSCMYVCSNILGVCSLFSKALYMI